MPKHALNRATIAELILSQLPQGANAQLFLLNFERLYLRDFSRYGNPRDFKVKRQDAEISEEYFSIIAELMKAEILPGHAASLRLLLKELDQAPPELASELARQRSDDVRQLFRFFPQDCFAYIGGAFFEAFLKGNKTPRGFRRVGQVYFANLDELGSKYSVDSPRYSKLPYTQGCGRLVSWLNEPFLPEKKGLYVVPVICDGSFFGLLYCFSDNDDKSVAAGLMNKER